MLTDTQTSPVAPIAPTVTMKWLKCPTFGYLDTHYEPVGSWKPHRLLGTALGKGFEVLLDPDNIHITTAGFPFADSVEANIEEILKAGYIEQDEWSLEALQALALKGLHAALAKDGGIKHILEHEVVLATELDVGGARVDLVSKRARLLASEPLSGFSDLIVTDHKIKLQSKPEWVTKDLLESEADWQLWDYAWRVGQYYSRPVTHIRRHLVVLSPRAKSYVHETRIAQDQVQAWLRGAEKEWSYIRTMMDVNPPHGVLQNLPMRLTSCYGRYGKCGFYEACHVANRDPERMKGLYVEKS